MVRWPTSWVVGYPGGGGSNNPLASGLIYIHLQLYIKMQDGFVQQQIMRNTRNKLRLRKQQLPLNGARDAADELQRSRESNNLQSYAASF